MMEQDSTGRFDALLARKPQIVERALIVVAILITWLFLTAPDQAHVALYLYFLPVSISGFYLGRYRSGLMAFFCVVSVATASGVSSEVRQLLHIDDVMALGVWGAVLGLTSILTGTVSDQRQRELNQIAQSHREDTLKDALTGIANRRAFDFELTRRTAELERQETPFALVLIDIDHFKKLNDTYGHPAGDAVIRAVARTLEEHTREMDLVARYGGEEFAIVMPKCGVEEAKDAAERVRRKIESSRFSFQDFRMRLTVSVGLAQALPGESVPELIERVDAALYASKQGGRNRSTLHNGESCIVLGEFPAAVGIDESGDLVAETASVDAFWDELTNLPSRRIFMEDLRRRVAEAQRYHSNLSIALIEIAGFQELLAHEPSVAQKAVCVIGELVCTSMRDADLVARYSLHQFVVSMPSTPMHGAELAADRLQIGVAQSRTVKHNGIPMHLSVQIGLATMQANEDAESLLARAEHAVQAQECNVTS